MSRINRAELVRIVVYNRRWLSLALVILIAYGVFNSLQPGTEVLMVTENVVAGQPITHVVKVRAAELPHGFIPANDFELAEMVSRVPLSVGTIVSRDILVNEHESNYVTVSLPIEAIAIDALTPGSRIHVWSLEENHASLVSDQAHLIAISAQSISTVATFQIPRADEYAVMQATAIRLTGVSQ